MGREIAPLLEFVCLLLIGVHLEIEGALVPAELGRLVDHGHRCAHGHQGIEPGDILGVEPDAAVAHPAPHAIGLVGAVDHVVRPAEIEGKGAERIVRPGRNGFRQVRLLRPDGGRREPGRVGPLGDDLGAADRRLVSLAADADRHAEWRPALGRKVVEPELGQIDDDAAAGAGRQQALGRQGDHGTLAGQPGIDPAIGRHELDIADIEAHGDVDQRVVVARHVASRLADQIIRLGAEGFRIGKQDHRDQRKEEGSGRSAHLVDTDEGVTDRAAAHSVSPRFSEPVVAQRARDCRCFAIAWR
jgi:hypothetical protein